MRSKHLQTNISFSALDNNIFFRPTAINSRYHRYYSGELAEHPKTGTGHPEHLKGQPANRWGREITKKHRMVYRIFDTEVYVEVLAAYGHYDDN